MLWPSFDALINKTVAFYTMIVDFFMGSNQAIKSWYEMKRGWKIDDTREYTLIILKVCEKTGMCKF